MINEYSSSTEAVYLALVGIVVKVMISTGTWIRGHRYYYTRNLPPHPDVLGSIRSDYI